MNQEKQTLSSVPGSPNNEVIAEIERLLEMAKSGQVIGLVYGAQCPGYQWYTGWCTKHNESSMVHLLGVIERLKFEMCHNWEVDK